VSWVALDHLILRLEDIVGQLSDRVLLVVGLFGRYDRRICHQSFNVQIAAADLVDGLVVDHESAVGVLEGGVRGEDRVVWLDDSAGQVRRWVHGEFEFGFLAVGYTQTLH